MNDDIDEATDAKAKAVHRALRDLGFEHNRATDAMIAHYHKYFKTWSVDQAALAIARDVRLFARLKAKGADLQ